MLRLVSLFLERDGSCTNCQAQMSGIGRYAGRVARPISGAQQSFLKRGGSGGFGSRGVSSAERE